MNAQAYWQLFLETGAPELYLLYANARKTEELYVPECPRAGSKDNSLQ